MDIQDIEKKIISEIDKTLEIFNEQLKKIQVGFIDGDFFGSIGINDKGKKVFLKNVAVVTVDDETVTIKPNNTSLIKEIEKSINNFKKDMPLKFTTASDKNQVVLKFDIMITQDIRTAYVNLCNKKCEDFRISLRGLRQDGFKKIKSLIKNEEEFKRNTKNLQLYFDKANKKVDDTEKLKIKVILGN